MESLPSEIILEIVSRVPAESVFDCKLVCKTWGALIRGRNFSNMHLNHQLNQLHGGDDRNDTLAVKVEPCLFFACWIDDPYEDRALLFHGGQLSDGMNGEEKYSYKENLTRIYHPPMHTRSLSSHLVGSCNGLVCTFQQHSRFLDPIYICNPLTREYVYLPKLVLKMEDVNHPLLIEEGEVDLHGLTACGFGYVKSTNEYKVVRIYYPKFGYLEGNVEVYTLGSGCGWRAAGKVFYLLETSRGGIATYANDAIYWISHNKIVAFDLADEEFRLVSVPPCLQNRQNSGGICGLVALGSHLCLYMERLHMEIWSLTENNDFKEAWCMEFDIDYEPVVGSLKRTSFQPISLTKNGEIIFLYDESVLYCYDTKTADLRMISEEAPTDYFEGVNTFASLEALGENSRRYTVRPRWVRTPWDDVTDELDRVALGEEIDTTHFRLRWYTSISAETSEPDNFLEMILVILMTIMLFCWILHVFKMTSVSGTG